VKVESQSAGVDHKARAPDEVVGADIAVVADVGPVEASRLETAVPGGSRSKVGDRIHLDPGFGLDPGHGCSLKGIADQSCWEEVSDRMAWAAADHIRLLALALGVRVASYQQSGWT